MIGINRYYIKNIPALMKKYSARTIMVKPMAFLILAIQEPDFGMAASALEKVPIPISIVPIPNEKIKSRRPPVKIF